MSFQRSYMEGPGEGGMARSEGDTNSISTAQGRYRRVSRPLFYILPPLKAASPTSRFSEIVGPSCGRHSGVGSTVYRDRTGTGAGTGAGTTGPGTVDR